MKFAGLGLCLLLMSLATVAVAQSDAQKLATKTGQSDMQPSASKPAPSDAEKSFALLKSLAGSWQAAVTTVPPVPEMGNGAQAQVTMRVTSRGNALVHEMQEWGKPDDPSTYDHPVTMLYLENDRLLLTHYCDAGNRPRMVARTSTDGNAVEFDFKDVSGGTQRGYMHHAVFTLIDANHHTEDWTYMMPGDKPLRAHMELKRINQ